MHDLPEFLLARIAEDEAVARAATPGPWKPEGIHEGEPANETWEITGPRGKGGWTADVVAVDYDRDYHMPMGGCPRREDAAHIARHDPARVLAECEAHRRIVDSHSGAHECPKDGDSCGWWLAGESCDVLRLLALPFVDHPDYPEEHRNA